jgi:FixJ family two-component response regulator
MQVACGDIDIAPTSYPYRNRPSFQGFHASHADPLGGTVYLVDEDPLFGDEISASLIALAAKVIAFPSASHYLNFSGRDTAACVILNTRLPDLSGLELQRLLTAQSSAPIIFVSDPCDVGCAVSAMKAGAIDFFVKPFRLPALIAAVQAAFIQDRKFRLRKAELGTLQRRFALLTPREREVLPLVVGGLLNKQAASLLGISEITLQIHRSQVMRKMQAESLADLVRMAVKLRISHWRDSPSVD